MKTRYYLCDQFGRYASQDGHTPMLVKSQGAAYCWLSADEAQAAAPMYSATLGTECRVVAHMVGG